MGFQFRRVHNHTVRGRSGGGDHAGINSDSRMVWETGYYYSILGNYDAPFTQTIGQDIADMLAAQD